MIKRNIPNAITSGNLLCGCLAIIKCFEGDLVWVAYLVGIAAVLDFFDGFVARLLKVSSPIGKDLDSLADMVTFGVVPGFVMFNLIGNAHALNLNLNLNLNHVPIPPSAIYWPQYLALFIPVFSGIRLAIFNNDTRQSESFIGLPTPANTILICSLPLILKYNASLSLLPSIFNPYTLCAMAIVLSLLLVAPIPLFALKFKNFGWHGNEIRFVFLMWSVLLIVFLQYIGIPLIIVSYILFSVANNAFKKSKS